MLLDPARDHFDIVGHLADRRLALSALLGRPPGTLPELSTGREVIPAAALAVVVDLPDGSEAIAIHPTGNLTLTWDHRAFDGAYASAFLARIKDILETRDWTAEL